jgi:hypothetical protein
MALGWLLVNAKWLVSKNKALKKRQLKLPFF